MIRVVIADDQKILAEGLKMLLSASQELTVVGIAENGAEAVTLTETLKPDVVLMDIQMPVMNGVDAIKIIKQQQPEVKCMILTTFSDDEYIFEGIKNGASGYLLKDATPHEIELAIISIYKGGAHMAPEVTAKMIDKMAQMMTVPDSIHTGNHLEAIQKTVEDAGAMGYFKELTERELEIVQLVSEGLSNLEIGERLFLTEGTVKNHLSKILQKVELRDRTQLAVSWLKR